MFRANSVPDGCKRLVRYFNGRSDLRIFSRLDSSVTAPTVLDHYQPPLGGEDLMYRKVPAQPGIETQRQAVN